MNPKFAFAKLPGSREGWANAFKMMELFAAHGCVLILDFSRVRPRGVPIR